MLDLHILGGQIYIHPDNDETRVTQDLLEREDIATVQEETLGEGMSESVGGSAAAFEAVRRITLAMCFLARMTEDQYRELIFTSTSIIDQLLAASPFGLTKTPRSLFLVESLAPSRLFGSPMFMDKVRVSWG